MKVVFRADDIGYSDFSNLGAFKAIDDGVVSHAEIMPDTPGAIGAMEFMRERPWISVNWHAHFWGNPVAGAENVPSMVAPNGRFITNTVIHRPITDNWTLEDCIKECRAQVERFIKYMGRVPDAADPAFGALGEAKKLICDEYGIVMNYSSYWHYGEGTVPGHMPGPNVNKNLDPKYASRHIYEYENFGRPGLKLEDYLQYDPMDMIKTIPESDENIWVRSEHPGWVCDYIWEDTWDICSITRCQDAEVLYSDELKTWLRENKVEIINLRDALYGSQEFQNHLKAIGSDLYVGK